MVGVFVSSAVLYGIRRVLGPVLDFIGADGSGLMWGSANIGTSTSEKMVT